MRRLRFLVSALCCFVMAVGCNEVAGIKDPVSDEGGAGPAAGIDRFYGTWSSSNGSYTVSNCSKATTASNQKAQVVLAKTQEFPLVVIIEGCSLATTVAGDVASLNDGQRCVAMGDATNNTVTLNYGPSTFSLEPGSSTQATESLTAKLVISNPTTGATIETCDYEEAATFTKL